MDGGNLGASQGIVTQSKDGFGNNQRGQCGVRKSGIADGSGVGGQSNSGQLGAICKSACTDHHNIVCTQELDLGQLCAAIKGIVADGDHIGTDHNLSDLGITLEDLSTDFLQIGVQLGHIAIQCSGIEQQFCVICGIQCIVVNNKVGISRIDCDAGDGGATCKDRAIEIAQRSRQINGGQSGATLEYVCTELNLLLAGLEGNSLNTATAGESALTYCPGAGGNDSLVQLGAACIGLCTNVHDHSAVGINDFIKLFVCSECTFADGINIDTATKGNVTQHSHALKGALTNGDCTLIGLVAAITLEGNGRNALTASKGIGFDEQISVAIALDHDLSNVIALNKSRFADFQNKVGNDQLGNAVAAVECQSADFLNTNGNGVFAAQAHISKQQCTAGSIVDAIIGRAVVHTASFHFQSGHLGEHIQDLQIHLCQTCGQTQSGKIGSQIECFGVNYQLAKAATLELQNGQLLTLIESSSGNFGNTITNNQLADFGITHDVITQHVDIVRNSVFACLANGEDFHIDGAHIVLVEDAVIRAIENFVILLNCIGINVDCLQCRAGASGDRTDTDVLDGGRDGDGLQRINIGKCIFQNGGNGLTLVVLRDGNIDYALNIGTAGNRIGFIRLQNISQNTIIKCRIGCCITCEVISANGVALRIGQCNTGCTGCSIPTGKLALCLTTDRNRQCKGGLIKNSYLITFHDIGDVTAQA